MENPACRAEAPRRSSAAGVWILLQWNVEVLEADGEQQMKHRWRIIKSVSQEPVKGRKSARCAGRR
jgi:hypothetical protein